MNDVNAECDYEVRGVWIYVYVWEEVWGEGGREREREIERAQG